MQKEKLYFSPAEFPGLSDAEAIQAAVDGAIREDVRVVQIEKKIDGTMWKLDRPILLPSFTTVILDGACVQADGIGNNDVTTNHMCCSLSARNKACPPRGRPEITNSYN